VGPAVASVFNNIGRAIAEGGNLIGAIGKGILGSFGQFLSEFGNRLIAYGVAALAFSETSKGLLNPLTAGPSALAAIAAGAVLSTLGGALSSVASGGLGGAGAVGSLSGGGQSFQGASTSFSGANVGGGTVVFEIQGKKLVGVLNRTLKADRRTLGDVI